MIWKTFWNHYAPAASGHYLICLIRRQKDDLPALDIVLLEDERTIRNVLSVKFRTR